MLRLILNPDTSEQKAFDLTRSPFLIGRAEDNDVSFLHKSLSRQHAKLELVEERVYLCDLGSKNGTFLNGQRVDRCELRAGDTFRCGEVPFRLERNELLPTLIQDLRTQLLGSMEDLLNRQHDTTTSALRVKPVEPGSRAQSKLRILLQVSQLLSSPEAIDGLLQKILDLVFHILDVDRAVILLVDAATGALVPRITRSADRLPAVSPGQPYSQHIVEYVRVHNVAALFDDARLDPRLNQAASVMLGSICTSMCVPLKPKDRLLGVLYVDSRSAATRYSAEDLEFLTAFASQAAVAIENANLYKRLEEEAVLRNNYLRFFPPTTLKKLELSKGAPLEVIETEVTALFSDISDYTGISSGMQPRQVVDMLNEYFPVMSDIVFRHEGTLEKYIGDALMAVWGAPFTHPDDVERALQAAVEMQQALRELNARWLARDKPELRIHIGLNTGRVAAGNIGSERYLQYATIGDATNVASRICGIAAPGEILISESTRSRLRKPRWPLVQMPPVTVKGKSEALTLYRVDWKEAV